MDNRAMGAAAVLGLALVAGVGAFVMSGGEQPAPAAPEPVEAATAEEKVDAAPDAPVDQAKPDAAVKSPRKEAVERDPEYMERAAKHREVREKRNQEWRDQTTAAAQKWVAANIPDEGKALLVMGSVQKYHDTIAAARRDVEDGVIGPAVFRDEMNMAKEDFKVELTNHVGAEDYERFMSETRQSPFVGF